MVPLLALNPLTAVGEWIGLRRREARGGEGKRLADVLYTEWLSVGQY